MGLNHTKSHKTIDATRCLTPTPVLGPIEEVNETDVADDKPSKDCEEVTALRFTFSSDRGPPKKPRRYSVAQGDAAKKPVKIIISKPPIPPQKLHRVPSVILSPPATSLDGTSPSTASSKYSHSNPSLHLTSSSSGISGGSAEETSGKRRTYGQLATQVKCRQVIVTAIRPERLPSVRMLSPKAISWAFKEGQTRKGSIEIKSPMAQIKKSTGNKLVAKPPLYMPKEKILEGIRRQKTVCNEEPGFRRQKTTMGLLGGQKGINAVRDNSEEKRGLERTETDLVPLTARIKSWSKANTKDKTVEPQTLQ